MHSSEDTFNEWGDNFQGKGFFRTVQEVPQQYKTFSVNKISKGNNGSNI